MDWFQAGHVAVVTGASRGLGKELARELLREGLRVIIDARDPDSLELTRLELARFGEVVAVAGDIVDPGHVHALIALADRFGRLDLLVNNASTLGKTPLPAIAQLDSRTFTSLFEVNVFAPIHLIQHALPLLQRSEAGTIVNITSDAGVEAYPTWGGYGASKAALEHVSRVLAAELDGSSTRVLVFDPGDMNTDMHRVAIPDADPMELRDPAESARALVCAVAQMQSHFERVRASGVTLSVSSVT
jgi:NAD(P)-dependent dehydrogenase (short-subunit alcohol dehydrogenase family)